MTDIRTNDELYAVTFSVDGKYLLSGDEKGVQAWHAENGRHAATMDANDVRCVVASGDGRWIAAGTAWGYLYLWGASSYEQVLKRKEDDRPVNSVDFSPDSTQLVTASGNRTATIWDVEQRKQIRKLDHEDWVVAARYSPHGDRIATGTRESVRIWDSTDGSLLVDFLPAVKVSSYYNRGLLWFNDWHLFVVSDGKVKKLDASTALTVFERATPNNNYGHVALPKHRAFIVCATDDTVSFWDTRTHSQFNQIQRFQQVTCTALSPDGRFIAIGGRKTVTIQSTSPITDVVPPSRLHSTIGEPSIQIDVAALDSWKRGQLEDVDVLLSRTIAASRIPNHHVLACRALVRARLKKWDIALIDADRAIEIQPSVIAYIAKGVAHAGNGDRHKAYRSCDISIERFHSAYVTFLLLSKAIVVFMAGERVDAISRMDDLIATVHFNSIFYVVQACMLLLHGNSQMENGNYDDAIRLFERARTKLRPHANESLLLVSLISGWKFDDLNITIRQRMCEALYSAGRTKDAGDSLLELVRAFGKEVYMHGTIANWVSDFTRRCLSVLECDDDPFITTQDTNMVSIRANTRSLLMTWAKATLVSVSWRDALACAVPFVTLRFAIYRVICEHLDATDRFLDATECLLDMMGKSVPEADGEQAAWAIDFKHRLGRKLEELGDFALNARQRDTAIVQYSAALSLNPSNPQSLLVKRSKARAILGWWRGALGDADDVITLDPLSPLGYERKHAALRVASYHTDAEVAFQTMLLRMSDSADPDTRERSRQYIHPTRTEAAIREAIQTSLHNSPLVLINTNSGRLLDKPGQASWFESQPIFHELVTTTTTHIDSPRIKEEVGQYYRYATFSHKWKANEPLYDDVIHAVVYKLEDSPTHNKLQMFCKVAHEAGLHWAWSDTVCINKADPSVLQEALVSMFQWYQSSTLTVILLCDVPWRRLVESIWNTRVWTFQEYHASTVIRFYNKDWSLYRGIDIPNHKESPEIIAEMEEATGTSAGALGALCPGLEDIREKLRLASTRQSTRIEDEAYSLLGIFSLSMPVVYGEGNRALGKLLAQLLTSSGDTSILAWTGESGSFNSCLPARIVVFGQPPTSHIPSAPSRAEMETICVGMRKALLNVPSVVRLYDRLNDLPVPMFNGRRMKLPSISFKLGPLAVSRRGSERVFLARAAELGVVEIKTQDDLLRLKSLTLVHPWIDFLLDRQPVGSMINIAEESVDDHPSLLSELPPLPGPSIIPGVELETRMGLPSRLRFPFARRASTLPPVAPSLRPPSTIAETDKRMCALRTLARLRQPFGGLLLTSDRGNVAAYRRVAADSVITVQVEGTSLAILDKLISNVRVLDVL